MVQCAAFNCTVKSGQGVSLYLFPKDKALRKTWTEKLRRKDFVPSKHSKLCERHFENDQFAVNPIVLESVSWTPKRKELAPNAVPSKFDFKRKIVEAKRKSTVQEKRRRLEVLGELLDENRPPAPPTDDVTVPHQDVTDDMPDDATCSNDDVGTQVDFSIPTYSAYSQTSYNLVKRRHIGLQTNIEFYRPVLKTIGTQTTVSQIRDTDDLNLSYGSEDCGISDPDWVPHYTEDVDQLEDDEEKDFNPAKERKFIIFESCLDKLFAVCCICASMCNLDKYVVGTYIHITSICTACGEIRKWGSQPLSGTMPYGNLVLAGAVLFSGSSPSKALRMLHHAAIQVFSLSTYMNIQSIYLVPTVLSVWKGHQQDLVSDVKEKGDPLVLGGDGRCCSPGHTAKYSSYTVMDLNRSKIIDIQLVQSNEVKNSYAMELEGLKRCLATMDRENLAVSHLVTDRHSQIKKFLRVEHPEIQHWFDCWHVAKGIFKKLEAAGKTKGYGMVGEWARSVSNHIYWCAMSSEGNGELVFEKWCSILNHVVDIHEGHGNLFQQCQHDNLEDRIWFKKDSKAYKALEKVVKGRLLLTDIKILSPAQQTSGLEAFHKVVCHFAPKLVHYFHAQMEARLCIAALHFNENCNRQQAVTQTGEAKWSISYPKARKGEGVAKEVKVKATYDYIDELFEELILRREINNTFTQARAANESEREDRISPRPSPLSKSNTHDSKEVIVSRHKSRFNLA